jgi:hypothetical protein
MKSNLLNYKKNINRNPDYHIIIEFKCDIYIYKNKIFIKKCCYNKCKDIINNLNDELYKLFNTNSDFSNMVEIKKIKSLDLKLKIIIQFLGKQYIIPNFFKSYISF